MTGLDAVRIVLFLVVILAICAWSMDRDDGDANMKRSLKIAYVLWLDALTLEKDDDKVDHFVQHSSGFLLQNNKKVVKLAQSWNEDGPAEILIVPRAYVREVRVVGTAATKPKPAKASSSGPRPQASEQLPQDPTTLLDSSPSRSTP